MVTLVSHIKMQSKSPKHYPATKVRESEASEKVRDIGQETKNLGQRCAAGNCPMKAALLWIMCLTVCDGLRFVKDADKSFDVADVTREI